MIIERASQRLADECLKPEAHVVFLTGAGISLASGIPTFRGSDPGAVWNNDVLEKGTIAYFHRKPVEQWLWYFKLFSVSRNAKPNPAHFAVTDIQQKVVARGGLVSCVTQNVDGLHTAAGTQGVIEVHGSAHKVRCSKTGCPNGAPHGLQDWSDEQFAAFIANPSMETLPRCPRCRKFIRPHTLWFDEMYNGHTAYGYYDALGLAPKMTCIVFVGTSFAVGITEMALDAVRDLGVPAFVVDPHMTQVPEPHLIHVPESAETFLPKVSALLG